MADALDLAQLRSLVAIADCGGFGRAAATLHLSQSTRHHPLERHLRDALCIRVHPPQEVAVLLAKGRRILQVWSARTIRSDRRRIAGQPSSAATAASTSARELCR